MVLFRIGVVAYGSFVCGCCSRGRGKEMTTTAAVVVLVVFRWVEVVGGTDGGGV